jgi:hypothetical protein
VLTDVEKDLDFSKHLLCLKKKVFSQKKNLLKLFLKKFDFQINRKIIFSDKTFIFKKRIKFFEKSNPLTNKTRLTMQMFLLYAISETVNFNSPSQIFWAFLRTLTLQ